MTKKPSIAEMMQARRAGLAAGGVPQIDPIAALTAPPAPATPQPETPTPIAAAPASNAAPPPAVAPAAPAPPAAEPSAAPGFDPRDLLVDVDRTEQLRMAGFHMYPSRHKQLKQLAFFEDRKQWEIIEDALTDYVKKHYGKKKRD